MRMRVGVHVRINVRINMSINVYINVHVYGCGCGCVGGGGARGQTPTCAVVHMYHRQGTIKPPVWGQLFIFSGAGAPPWASG